MALLKDIAIALRRLDYSETSQVLVLFTREHGQQRIIAKGIKRCSSRRVSVGIDLLEMGHAVFSARSGKEDTLATLTEWRQEDTFPHLRSDLLRLYAAQYAAEVTSQLTEVHDPHPRLFDGLLAFLATLARGNPMTVLVGYLRILLTEIGLRPELARCVGCGRSVTGDPVLFFSSRQGGGICRDCEPASVEKRRLMPAVAKALTEPGPVPAPLASPCFDVLDYHLTEIMSRPAQVAGPLREALKAGAGRK